MRALASNSGFLVALVAATAASLFAVAVTRRPVRSIALGCAVIVATLAGLGAEDVLNAELAVGLSLVAAGALAARRLPIVIRAAAFAPGAAVLVTLAAEGTATWARALAFGTIVGAGPAAMAFDRRFPYLTFAALGLSAAGAYATVPDTEQAGALVGALVPAALLGLVYRETPEPSSPSLGVSLVAWVALTGGVGRPGSVVGAIGCLGVLALGPLSRRSAPILIVAVHIVVVALASRVIGRWQSASAAAAVMVPVMIAGGALLAVSGRRTKRKQR